MKTNAVCLCFTLVAVVQTAYSASFLEEDLELENLNEDGDEQAIDVRDKTGDETASFNAKLLMSPFKVCPDGFSYRKHNCGYCYKLITTPHSWQKASEACHALAPDAHLVFINSEEEQQAVVSWLQTQPVGLCPIIPDYPWLGVSYWLGGQRSNPGDGTSPFYWKTAKGVFHSMYYNKWAGGEPNNFSNLPESCAHMIQRWNHQWNDLKCRDVLCSICEYDP